MGWRGKGGWGSGWGRGGVKCGGGGKVGGTEEELGGVEGAR